MGNLEKPIPESKFTPYSLDYECFLLGCKPDSTPKHNADCFFFSKEQDMHATIPCCDYKQKYWGDRFDCSGCHAYVPNRTVFTLIKSMVDNGEFDKLEEERDAE